MLAALSILQLMAMPIDDQGKILLWGFITVAVDWTGDPNKGTPSP